MDLVGTAVGNPLNEDDLKEDSEVNRGLAGISQNQIMG